MVLTGGMVLTGAADLTVNTPLTWSGGTMLGLGKTIANGGMLITGSAPKTLLKRTLDNPALAIWDEGPLRSGQGAVLNNFATGTFDIQADELLTGAAGGGPVAVFNNAGTLRKSAGPGETAFAMSSTTRPRWRCRLAR